ncbi:MAG: helix-turn-helix domain-containing protein [Chloroflexi bacterium]|nr:helix-turn-helix domain-containing protein [Chloroflexota bacterium]
MLTGTTASTCVMAGKARSIVLTEAERHRLEALLPQGSVERRLAQRARIVLEGAAGMTSREIARRLELRPATVSKWRVRFAERRIAGLSDAPRPGAPRRYGVDTERRILSLTAKPPPHGRTAWTGELIADALGDVSRDQVWRVLRRHGIRLRQD